jgi:hypothetical protein
LTVQLDKFDRLADDLARPFIIIKRIKPMLPLGVVAEIQFNILRKGYLNKIINDCVQGRPV